MVIKVNKRFKELFIKYIKNSAYNYSNSYSSSYSSGASKSINIYFYEWSSLSGGCKVYRDRKEFYDFLKSSNIICTSEQKQLIDDSYWLYATCIPGKNILLLESQYFSLKDKLEKCNANKCTSLAPMYY